MKKLMIAAAIVCAAAMSQAAALKWSVGSITAPEGGTLPETGANAISYWMDATTYDTFTGLAADKVAAYCAANALYSSTDWAVSRSKGTASGATGDIYSTGTEVSGYVVVFDAAVAADAENYLYSGVATKSAPSSGNIDNKFTFGSAASATTTTAWNAVPEPTSGLLLLLGVAGLALRRRRA